MQEIKAKGKKLGAYNPKVMDGLKRHWKKVKEQKQALKRQQVKTRKKAKRLKALRLLKENKSINRHCNSNCVTAKLRRRFFLKISLPINKLSINLRCLN